MPIESYSEIAEQQQTARNRLGNMAKAEFEKEAQNQVKVAEHFGANCLTETETLCFHSAQGFSTLACPVVSCLWPMQTLLASMKADADVSNCGG